MAVSYKKLWKVLIDKDLKKKDMKEAANISWATVTKLSKGEYVSMEILERICRALEVDFADVVEVAY